MKDHGLGGHFPNNVAAYPPNFMPAPMPAYAFPGMPMMQQPPPPPAKMQPPPPPSGKSSGARFKKAPDAPKRFKSAFIIFSAEKHKEIKGKLTEEGKAGKVKVRRWTR